ncbi:hypothetical protein D3C79_958740 [compost metagenome]
MTWFYVEVISGLEPTLPRGGIDIDVIVDITSFKVHVTANRLVDPFLCSGGHFDKGIRTKLEARFVYILYVLWNCINLLHITLRAKYIFFYFIPKIEFFEVVYKVYVYFKELTVKCRS